MTYEQKLEQAKENLSAAINQLAIYAYCDDKEKLLEQAKRVREIRKEYLDLVGKKPK